MQGRDLASQESHVQKINVVELRKLRSMCRHTMKGMIMNEDIEKKMGMAFMVDKMREVRLKWFWRVRGDAPVSRGGFTYMEGVSRAWLR